MHFRSHICFHLDIGKLYFDCGVSILIAAPLTNFSGSGKRLVLRDSEICVFEMFGVFATQTRWHRHSCD